MAQSLIKVYLHLIFHIKTTSPEIRDNDLEKLHAYIAGIMKGLDSNGLCVGGTQNHVHVLCTMPKHTLIPDFVQKIKVASHKYIEQLSPTHYRLFAWQSGYGVFSVSPSVVENVRRYIKNQPEHHRKHTFEEEYRRFMSEYHVEESDERYLFCD